MNSKIETEDFNDIWLNPVDGIITSTFGKRINPILNKEEFHKGIDIGAEEGSYIIAVKKGKVLEIKLSSTYGNILKYETEDGYVIIYAHCKDIFVKKDEFIEKGQIVASVGNTGGLSTGPHLHYEISKNGVLIDPINYVNLPVLKEAIE
ncbi:M23 family metallopeptidase [Defluviitalea phaphyphila]|uniref:M23 family metallopeptidase n=1 Tax=Defluviitalea phaphyphila TaxID=1473580 RepID=UPI0007310E32|nr:M23 family metallopeptidase [Defluviitalea phaphyphila]